MKTTILSFILSALLVVTSCKKDDDPNLAFKNLTLTDTKNTGPMSWIVSGNYRVVTCDSVLGVSDYSNPLYPGPKTPSGNIKMVANDQFIMSQDGQSFLLTNWDASNGLADVWTRWIDFSDPLNLQVKAEINSEEFRGAGHFFVAGLQDGFLYTCENSNKLVCYNLNEAIGKQVNNILELKVGEYVLDGISGIMHSHQVGNFLYVGGNGSHIYVLDITNRAAPKIVAHIDDQSSDGFRQTGNTLMNLGNGKLLLIDVSNPGDPELLYRINEKYSDAQFHNGYLYIGHYALFVYDINNPRKPKLVKKISMKKEERITHLWFLSDHIVASSTNGSWATPYLNTLFFSGNNK